MALQHEDAYLESRVYAATPAELIQLLYETALEAVREAMQAQDSSLLALRTRAISRASSCVMELSGSLNLEVGGELGQRLSALYEYLLHELLEASARRQDHSLPTCERVLASLLEGWSHAMSRMGEGGAMPGDGISAPAPIVSRVIHVQPQAGIADEDEQDQDMVGQRASWCA